MGYTRKITCKMKSWNPVRRSCFSLGSLCLNFLLLAVFFFFYCRLVFIACHFVMACIKLSSVGGNCYKIRFKQTPSKGKSLGTRRHSRKVWENKKLTPIFSFCLELKMKWTNDPRNLPPRLLVSSIPLICIVMADGRFFLQG